jgi:hypothetical protein
MNQQSLNRTMNDARYRLTREVREHPLFSIGVAIGVGALLGALAGQAATPTRRKNWLTDVATDLSDRAHDVGNRARRVKRVAARELNAATTRANKALPDVNYDLVVRRGRHWLSSLLS